MHILCKLAVRSTEKNIQVSKWFSPSSHENVPPDGRWVVCSCANAVYLKWMAALARFYVADWHADNLHDHKECLMTLSTWPRIWMIKKRRPSTIWPKKIAFATKWKWKITIHPRENNGKRRRKILTRQNVHSTSHYLSYFSMLHLVYLAKLVSRNKRLFAKASLCH